MAAGYRVGSHEEGRCVKEGGVGEGGGEGGEGGEFTCAVCCGHTYLTTEHTQCTCSDQQTESTVHLRAVATNFLVVRLIQSQGVVREARRTRWVGHAPQHFMSSQIAFDAILGNIGRL